MANWDIIEDLIYGSGFLGTGKGVAFVNGKGYILKALYELFARFPAWNFLLRERNMYFVILYTFNASCGYTEAEQQKLFADHVRYIKGLHANKKIVMSGAYNDINGGLVILEVESRKEAEIIMAEDPALKSLLYHGEFHEWQVVFKQS